MPPIHAKPPYATDEPDSSYESAPIIQRRVRQVPQGNPNDRSSAYDVYHSYLGGDDNAASRQSGVGALGLGLLNMDDDDDDDDDDKYPKSKTGAAIPEPTVTAPLVSSSKHAALAAATAAAGSTNVQHIVAPKPGYPAPIATLNNLARPEAAVSFQTRAPPVSPIDNVSQISLRNPFADPNPSPISREHRQHDAYAPSSPSSSPSMVSSSPHPLQPPMTPITPVFARPAKGAIKFSDAAIANGRSKPIMRGDSEQTLLPNRGEKGDDFWRRFSMVAKEENNKSQKTSKWLKETQDGSMRLSRWVWVTGVIILAVIGGAIGIGWYVSHKTPDHQQPKAFGGSANEAATGVSSSTMASVGPAGSTIRHVSATHTIDRRFVVATSTPVPQSRHSQQRRLYSH